MGSVCSSINLCCSGCLHCWSWQTHRQVKKGNKHLEELRKQLRQVSTESQLIREEIRQQRQPPPSDGSGGGGGTTIVVVRDPMQLRHLQDRLLGKKQQILHLQTAISAVEKAKNDHELKLLAPKLQAAHEFAAKSHIKNTRAYQALHQDLSRTVVASEMRRSEQRDMDKTLEELQGGAGQESTALLDDDPDLQGFARSTEEIEDEEDQARTRRLPAMPSVPTTAVTAKRKDFLEMDDLKELA